MSDLSRFRVDDDPAPQPGFTYADVVHQGVWLCFDQALATTGWAELHASASTGFAVVETGMILTEATDDKGGYEDSFRRGEVLYAQARRLIERITPEFVAVELPVAMGTKFKGRRESGIVACTAVRCAALESGVRMFPVQAQRAKKVVAGKATASKAEMSAAVKGVLPALGAAVRVNQHTMDAVALGLTAATGRG